MKYSIENSTAKNLIGISLSGNLQGISQERNLQENSTDRKLHFSKKPASKITGRFPF